MQYFRTITIEDQTGRQLHTSREEVDADHVIELMAGAEPAHVEIVDKTKDITRAKVVPGVAKKATWSPASRPAADHPYRAGGRKASYDKEAILEDIDAGMKPKDIAEKHGVKAAVVYNVRSNGNRDRGVDSPGPAPKEEAEPRPTPPASAAMKRDPITAEQFKEVKRLFHEGKKLTTEIAKITGLDGEEINIAVQAQAYGMYIFNRKRKQ